MHELSAVIQHTYIICIWLVHGAIGPFVYPHVTFFQVRECRSREGYHRSVMVTQVAEQMGVPWLGQCGGGGGGGITDKLMHNAGNQKVD